MEEEFDSPWECHLGHKERISGKPGIFLFARQRFAAGGRVVCGGCARAQFVK